MSYEIADLCALKVLCNNKRSYCLVTKKSVNFLFQNLFRLLEAENLVEQWAWSSYLVYWCVCNVSTWLQTYFCEAFNRFNIIRWSVLGITFDRCLSILIGFLLIFMYLTIVFRYKIVLDSDAEQYNGHMRLQKGIYYFTSPEPWDGRSNHMLVSSCLRLRTPPVVVVIVLFSPSELMIHQQIFVVR